MKREITKISFNARCIYVLFLMFMSAGSASAADEYTVELYDTYCKACHSVAGVGAPVAFNKDDWQERIKQGLETLVNNAVNGIGNMPAQGSCQECSYEDFEDLIGYMSVEK